jgi:hypothetical protein
VRFKGSCAFDGFWGKILKKAYFRQSFGKMCQNGENDQDWFEMRKISMKYGKPLPGLPKIPPFGSLGHNYAKRRTQSYILRFLY